LGAYSDNGAVVFSRVSAARPKVGSYKVVEFRPGAESPEQFHALVSLGPVSAPLGVFRAVSGTVTILQSTEAKIVGRYEVKAVGFLAADPENEDREITVRGGFTAEPATGAATFEPATDGAVQAAPSGSAEFGTVDDNGRALFTLNMGAYSQQGAIVLTRGGARPACSTRRAAASRSSPPPPTGSLGLSNCTAWGSSPVRQRMRNANWSLPDRSSATAGGTTLTLTVR